MTAQYGKSNTLSQDFVWRIRVNIFFIISTQIRLRRVC